MVVCLKKFLMNAVFERFMDRGIRCFSQTFWPQPNPGSFASLGTGKTAFPFVMWTIIAMV